MASRMAESRGRSIPACAGEPVGVGASHSGSRVYPRVCGGTVNRHWERSNPVGLSPRVRGNLADNPPGLQVFGSIPACAGEPALLQRQLVVSGVYPRVCGGTDAHRGEAAPDQGLSPRVRGNHHAGELLALDRRSIPACAGEPGPATWPSRPCWVYPRVCGGTSVCSSSLMQPPGLSPRVRGNRDGHRPGRRIERSIPACAGEPRIGADGRAPNRVYPRVCGGTPPAATIYAAARGLSPRVRGNPAVVADLVAQAGSIPACAGEPVSSGYRNPTTPVYPRVCGGTPTRRNCPCVCCAGLSPRVRGNLIALTPAILAQRSIPACAGEPRCPPFPGRAWRVYPRVCGGTLRRDLTLELAHGLSPRVRGNHDLALAALSQIRSIPACAGEPRSWWQSFTVTPVYPRVCGGTRSIGCSAGVACGLSPRVRGNPTQFFLMSVPQRSIPACAGEPKGVDNRIPA